MSRSRPRYQPDTNGSSAKYWFGVAAGLVCDTLAGFAAVKILSTLGILAVLTAPATLAALTVAGLGWAALSTLHRARRPPSAGSGPFIEGMRATSFAPYFCDMIFDGSKTPVLVPA